MRRVVVVGASLAGVHAAEALRDGGFDGAVTLVGAEHELPYDRPPLSKAALRSAHGPAETLLRAPAWYQERDIRLLLGTAAHRLDLGDRVVELDDGTRLGYDGLVLATGSAARPVVVTGDTSDVLFLRTAADCRRLRDRLIPGARLVVIGAGFIGLEVAASARERGLEVTVVELGPSPLAAALGDDVGEWFRRLHEVNGVHLMCGTGVAGIERTGQGSRVRLTDGSELPAELVVAGVGAVPAVGWLADSGLELDDGVRCDEYLRTAAADVVAAGDIARWRSALYGEHIRVEHWTNAVEQGRFAGQSLLRRTDEPFLGVPYFWTDQFTAKVRFVGRTVGCQTTVVSKGDRSLVAVYTRGGAVHGAVCVNAPRELVRYRQAIVQQTPWRPCAATA